MRFRISNRISLTEAEDAEWVSDLRKAKTAEERDTIIKSVISKGLISGIRGDFVDDKYKSIRSIIAQSIIRNGESNNFIDCLVYAGDNVEPGSASKLRILYQFLDSKILNYSKLPNDRLWTSSNLWDMKDDEFEYTIRVFNIASDEEEAKLYYDDPSKIDVEDLFNGAEIKDSGLHDKREGTIWDQVEIWSDNEKEEFGNKKEGSDYSIKDIFEKRGLSYSTLEDRISSLADILKEDKSIDSKGIFKVVNYLSDAKNKEYSKKLFSRKELESTEIGEVADFIRKEFKL